MKGKGLGKRGQGTPIPVGIDVRVVSEPIGLGHVNRYRDIQSLLIIRLPKAERKRKARESLNKNNKEGSKENSSTVFDFMNEAFKGNKRKVQIEEVHKLSTPEIQEKLFTNTESISHLRKRLSHYKNSLERHKSEVVSDT